MTGLLAESDLRAMMLQVRDDDPPPAEFWQYVNNFLPVRLSAAKR